MRPSSTTWRERINHFFDRELWSTRTEPRSRLAWMRGLLQFVVVVVQEFARGQLLLRASALTYYTVLALIPLLALAASIVAAVGVREDLTRLIVARVAAGSPEAGARILELVARVDFARLGTVGAAALVLTTILGISSIERSFNGIWGLRRPRSWERRVPDYLAVLIVAPLLLGVALSLGTTLHSQTLVQRLFEVPGFEPLYRLGLRQMPLLFLWFGFGFLYWFLPNTRVRVPSALLGGLVAAILFTVAQRAYLGFNVGAARYNALFGGLAALPLLLVWIYVSWVIVLFGAEVAFAHQHLAFFQRARRRGPPTPATREAIGLAIATRVGRAFRDGGEALTPDALAEDVDAPVRTVLGILAELEQAGIVATRGEGEQELFQLGRAAERIPATAVLQALRGRREQPPAAEGAPVGQLLAEVDRRGEEALAGVTLADLVDRTPTAS